MEPIDSSKISLDMDSLDGALAIADSVGGTLGITTEGRLLIYGVPNTTEQAERINGNPTDDPDRPNDGWWAFVEDIGDGYLAFDL